MADETDEFVRVLNAVYARLAEIEGWRERLA